eukprot:4019542-Amphidinium_carterae.2
MNKTLHVGFLWGVHATCHLKASTTTLDDILGMSVFGGVCGNALGTRFSILAHKPQGSCMRLCQVEPRQVEKASTTDMDPTTPKKGNNV